jgi:hypothetical protein
MKAFIFFTALIALITYPLITSFACPEQSEGPSFAFHRLQNVKFSSKSDDIYYRELL